MFAKSFSKLAILALSLSLPYQALGHAVISPALGVSGTPARSDATKPSSKSPCGNGVNVASAIAGSTSVAATGNAFTVSVTNFNAGTDGSTEITASSVDPTGTGASFAGGSATITTNGVKSPTSTGTVQVSGSLPAGTTCTGGSDGASCLVSFTTAGGFGNCVLVSQGAGGAGAAAAGANSTAAGTAAAGAGAAAAGAGAAAAGANSTTTATGATGAAAAAAAGGKAKGAKGKGKAAAKANAAKANAAKAAGKAAGTRLARGLNLRKSLGESLEKKRSWIWA